MYFSKQLRFNFEVLEMRKIFQGTGKDNEKRHNNDETLNDNNADACVARTPMTTMTTTRTIMLLKIPSYEINK